MKFILLFLILLFIYQARAQEETSTKIAFLADVHFQDLFGTLKDTEFRGLLNFCSKKYTLLKNF